MTRVMRSWARVAIGLGLVAGTLAVSTVAAQATVPFYLMRNANSGLCLSIVPLRTGPSSHGPVMVGGEAEQNSCTGDEWGAFALQPSDNGTYRLVLSSNRCLEVQGGSLANGAPTKIANCNGDWRQQWWRNGTPDGRLEFANRRSEKCLEVRNGATNAGAVVQQFACNGNDNQHWTAE